MNDKGSGAVSPVQRPGMNPRLPGGEAIAAVPTVEGRIDARALDLLKAHPDFDGKAFAWVGSEHLGGGIYCASVYTGAAAADPYLFITDGLETEDGFLVCVWVGDPDGSSNPTIPSSSLSAALTIWQRSRCECSTQRGVNDRAGCQVASRPPRSGPMAAELEVRLTDGGHWQVKAKLVEEGDWRSLCRGHIDGSIFDIAKPDREGPIRIDGLPTGVN